MPLDILFVDRTRDPETLVNRFDMTATADGWLIPEVRISPQDRLLLISRFAVEVHNDPEKRGLSPEPVALRIRAAFPSGGEIKPLKPLNRSKSLVGILIPDAGDLPPNFEGDLTLTIHYFESENGAPVGVEQSVTGTCRLSSRSTTVIETDLSVRPNQLAVLPGIQGLFLIDVRFARSDAPPKVALAHPNTVVAPDDPQAPAIEPFRADLRAALEAALEVAPGGPEVTGDTRTYQQAVLVRPSQACRNGLAGLEHGLEVPLDVLVPGRKGVPARVKLLLESERHPFPGWVVIDFGTSNSTASVHDPHMIDPPAGLPAEQQRFLHDGFKAWFDANNKEGFRGGRGFDLEWRRYYQELNNLTHPHGVDGCLVSGDSEKFYDLLAKVEDGLPGCEVAFRRVLQRDIQQIYHQALRVPTLEKFNLYPITLDRTEGMSTLLSEMEIIGVREVSKSFSLLDVAMGSTVRQTRRQMIAKAGGSDLKGVLSRFHPSPKRYFGTDRPAFTVEVDGKQHVVSVDDLMLAGWRHMLRLADEARDKREDGLRSNGPFRKVILTYPTVAPPSVRNRIQGLIRRLGISDVRTDYDEAVAVAIFYLMREYSSVTEMGLESFKARCRVRDGNSWVQNVLVFDIGGGTTDVALIRLTVRDVPVFEANEPVEERGAGGRFYRVEPQLLSSTGDMQLGGELMTLRVFRLLKASLADTLLSMAQSRGISSDSLNRILAGNIPPQFQEKQQGKFKPGSLRKFFEQEAPELADTGRWQEAKDLANRVLPTRWGEEGDNRAARLQAFDTLWKMAEAAKIQLGRRQANPAEPRAPYIADDRDVRQLVETCCKDLSPSPAEALKGVSLELHAEQLEVTIGKVVKEAVMLAMGTLEHLDPEEKVDWLILSGQSCNLELVDKEIRRQFAASDKFVWNPERVTFEKDYAKLATSIGACFAEEYRRRNVQPKAFRDKLRQGLNFLEYSINNMFSTLPCYFELRLPAGATKPLFRAGLELCEIDFAPDHDEDHRAKARSGWLDSAMQMTVMRQDYKHGPDNKPGKMNRWGDFAAQSLADDLKMTPAYFQANVKVKFEVDHKLDMEVLVCRFEDGQTEPDYQARAAEAQYNIAASIAALGRLRTPTSAPAGKTPAPAPAPGATHPVPPLFDAAGQLLWDIAASTPNSTGYFDVFRAGQVLNTRIHPHEPSGAPRRCLLCAEGIDGQRFPSDGKLGLYGRPKGANRWERLATIAKPSDEPVFRKIYRLTLSEDGVIRVHDGEPLYHETRDDPTVLRDKPGHIYRARLDQDERKTDDERDPYSGLH